MGVSAAMLKDKIPGKMPAASIEEVFDTDALEAQALASRLDVDMQRQDVAIIDKARALRHWGMFTAVELGASSERDPDGVRVTGPTLQMELPIFNRGQADRARLLAQYRQARAKQLALELSVRSEVRQAVAELMSAQATLEEHRKNIAPIRSRIVELAQERYNAMTLSPLELLLAKQEQLNSEIEQLEATRNYWTRLVELERAIGGRLRPTDNSPEEPAKTLEEKPSAPDEHHHEKKENKNG
jgi:cobalt-zinc-cadmium efflux system outer membrane protein